MKSIFKLSFVVFLFLNSVQLYGQDKFHVHLDYNYLAGFYEKGDLWTIKSGLSGFDINLVGMYNVSDRLAAGAGIGAEKLYGPPEYTLFPVFAKVTYAPLRRTAKPYVFTRLGYAFGTKISNPGLLLSPGIGYTCMLRKRFGFNFMLGYHLQSVRYDMFFEIDNGEVLAKTTSSNFRHSLAAGIGFIF
jgi:hypothetical protein